MPKVTVLMAAYNAEGTVERAVRSVCAEIFDDWSLVVVNDGSRDATGTLADKWARQDPRIRVIHLPENVGAAAAMNVGWRSTDSDYVAILDADDISLPNRLMRETAFLDENPQVDVVGAAAYCADNAGAYLRTIRLPPDHEALERRRWYASPFLHSSVLMKRSFLVATGGYTNGLRLGEDFDLWMRGFQRTQFRYANLQDILVVYQSRPVQRWAMIKAGAKVRILAGKREGRRLRGYTTAARILGEGLVEQTGVFAWREQQRKTGNALSERNLWSLR